MTRYTPPVEFEDVDHTADVGIVVRGSSAEEALARLILAFSELLSGGGAVPELRQISITIGGGDLASIAVDALRELLFRFDAEQILPASCEVRSLSAEHGAELSIGVGDYDPDAHAEGLELKAVTLHEARFEREPAGWVARIVFDI